MNAKSALRTYRSQTTLRSSLQNDSLYYSAPENLKKRIQKSLRKEARAEVSPRRWGWRWLTVGASLAFMLLVGVVAWRLAPRSIRPSGDELLAQEIVSITCAHYSCLVISPMCCPLISTQLSPGLTARWISLPRLKTLPVRIFVSIGGRLAYLNNRPVATLIYQRRLHYINLFIWPTEQAGSTGEA